MNAKSVKRMTWRQQSEGLDALCTPKGSHVGTSGRIAHFIVAISFIKGLVLCEQYFSKISGEMFADFIHKHFAMPVMPCTKWGPKNSVCQHGALT